MMASDRFDLNDGVKEENKTIKLIDEKLEKILFEKKQLMAKLRNSIINSSQNNHKRNKDEIEFLLKRF